MQPKASYRVQVRNTGEPWRTVSRAPLLEMAEDTAAFVAGLQVRHGEHQFPRHQYVRIVLGDQVCWSRPRQERVS